jgi:hypothetical protein
LVDKDGNTDAIDLVPKQISDPLFPQAGPEIIDRLIFNAKISSILVTLNGLYNHKKVISPLNLKDWSKSSNNLAKQLKNKGVKNQDHVSMICNTVDSNVDEILKFIEEYQYQNQKTWKPTLSSSSKKEESARKNSGNIPKANSFEEWQTKLIEKFNTLYNTVQQTYHIYGPP